MWLANLSRCRAWVFAVGKVESRRQDPEKNQDYLWPKSTAAIKSCLSQKIWASDDPDVRLPRYFDFEVWAVSWAIHQHEDQIVDIARDRWLTQEKYQSLVEWEHSRVKSVPTWRGKAQRIGGRVEEKEVKQEVLLHRLHDLLFRGVEWN